MGISASNVQGEARLPELRELKSVGETGAGYKQEGGGIDGKADLFGLPRVQAVTFFRTKCTPR